MLVRKAAITCITQIIFNATKTDISMQDIQLVERNLLHEYVYGVLRRYYSLEADFSRFCKTKPDHIAYSALALGTYQLRHMRVPNHAAVAETVAAMHQLNPKAVGFVNAVLRQVASHDAPKRLKPNQRAELPKWMYTTWRDAFGAEVVQSFCAALQHIPMLAVAVFVDRQEWMVQVQAMGIQAEVGALSPYAVLLPAGTEITTLPGFLDGAFTVMDQAAQAAVMALRCVPTTNRNTYILDVCAAPGGKTALLAHRFPEVHIIAIELNHKRIPRLQENLSRLQLNNVEVIQADAMRLPFAEGSIDALFLDAPCSASGILRRHPDAKLLHDQQAVEDISHIQTAMLHESLRVLKAGSQMLYAVCSIHPQENEHVLMGVGQGARVHQQTRLFPAINHDGFFHAAIEKLAS